MADNARSFCQPDQTILLLFCLVKIRESLKSKLCCLLSSGAGRGRYRLFTFLLRSNVVTPLSLPMHQISNQRKIICPPGLVDTRQHRPLPPDIPRLPVLRQTALQMRQHLYKWLCHLVSQSQFFKSWNPIQLSSPGPKPLAPKPKKNKRGLGLTLKSHGPPPHHPTPPPITFKHEGEVPH